MRIALMQMTYSHGVIPAGQVYDPATSPAPSSLPSLEYDETTMAAAVRTWRALEAQLSRSVSLLDVLRGSPGVFGADYTPTLTDTTNVALSTLAWAYWERSGDRVTVHFEIAIDPTAAVATELQISLPIAQDMAAATELVGSAVGDAGTEALINGDATSDAAAVTYTAPGLAAETFRGSFSYVLAG